MINKRFVWAPEDIKISPHKTSLETESLWYICSSNETRLGVIGSDGLLVTKNSRLQALYREILNQGVYVLTREKTPEGNSIIIRTFLEQSAGAEFAKALAFRFGQLGFILKFGEVET